ncbi:alpha-2-macroglobulin-like [Terrapene carolina triunguis]|uniref:alpha-2-macroglobulin-like n=1 Tax=Terrapene triunguis TaxID=2587831 RepID=UPI0011561AD9|nr:alpha-2-macroglobulin-like [Terrapene carolina triunguis]
MANCRSKGHIGVVCNTWVSCAPSWCRVPILELSVWSIVGRIGYQRQLNYKHLDGSYSTFGEHYRQPGNTWLTAFVLKSFAQARSHIFIEEKHIQDALSWLAGKQKENGCFHSSGTLLNNAIKGGVDDEVTLSAYITIALLEIPLPITVRIHTHKVPFMSSPGS